MFSSSHDVTVFRNRFYALRGKSFRAERCFTSISHFTHTNTHTQHIFFDEARELLILIQLCDSGKRPLYFTLSIKQEKPKLSSPIDFINPGEVIGLRFSASKRFLAIQRSDTRVDIVDLLQKTELELYCRYKATNRLIRHGMIWCTFERDSETLYLITQRGIEVYRISTSGATGTTCKHMRTIKQRNVSRYWFSPTRVDRGSDEVSSVGVCVLGTGKNGEVLCPFVLSSFSPLRVRKFQIEDSKTRPIKSQEIRIACVYDHMYCIHLHQKQSKDDKTSNVCKLYHIAKDGVTLTHVLPLYTNTTSSLRLQIVDNLIIIHDMSTQCSMIFDLKYVSPSSSSSTKSKQDNNNTKRIPIVNPLMIGMDISKTLPLVKPWIKVAGSEFEVVFEETGPLGLELMWSGGSISKEKEEEEEEEEEEEGKAAKKKHRKSTIVCGFHRSSSGIMCAAEKCGKIRVGDYLIAVNNESTEEHTFKEILDLIKESDRPLRMKFREWGRYTVLKEEEEEKTTSSSTLHSSQLPLTQTQCCKVSKDSKMQKRYSTNWQYLWPAWILDKSTKSRRGKLWRIDLRLEDIVRSKASDPYFVVPFLQRRLIYGNEKTKSLLLDFVRNLMCENVPLHMICYVFTLLNKVLRAWNVSIEKKNQDSEHQNGYEKKELSWKNRTPRNDNGMLVVTMRDMYEYVFKQISNDDRVSDSDAIKVILEYMRNLQFHRTTPLPCLFELVAKILVRSKRHHTLYQYMQYHLHQDSAEIAQIAYDASHEYKPLRQLAMDIWSRLGYHGRTVRAHLESKEIVAAMHVVLKQRKSFEANSKLMKTFFFYTVDRISRKYIVSEVLDRIDSLPDIRRLRVFLNRWYGAKGESQLNSDVLELLHIKKGFSERTNRFVKASAMSLLNDGEAVFH